MLGISLTVLFSALAAFAVWSYYINPALKSNVKKDNNAMYIIAAAAVAFILRLILGAVYRGHNTDMSCFIGWSNAVFENGFGKFYTLDMFHDYPPGYMYVLYIVGAIEKLFGFSDGAQYALVKLPAIVCDILAGVLIYKVAKKRITAITISGIRTALKTSGNDTPKIKPIASANTVLRTYKIRLMPQFCLQLIILKLLSKFLNVSCRAFLLYSI